MLNIESYQQNSDKCIDEIISELNDCREDERNAQNQIVQIIGVGGALLAAILGAAVSIAEKDTPVINDHIEKEFSVYLFYLNSVILIVSVFYITSIGITNVLRYHYMRELEDRLAILLPRSNEEETFIHWMSFSSPITTRNPFHAKDSKYSIVHYVSYAISTVLAVIFCIATTIFQYNNIKQHNWLITLPFIFTLLSMAISIFIFITVSIKAPNMYNYARGAALTKRTIRLTGLELSATVIPQKRLGVKDNFRILIYYLYPKKKDFQKWFLILLGFISGAFLSDKPLTAFSTLKEFLICFLVVDFLMYQARYLWNDIRGVFEDASAGKTNRLPVEELGGKAAILLAIINIIIRLIAAILISILYGGNATVILFSNIFIIITVSILYELSRAYKLDICVFFLVSLGYPIRFFAGLCAAYPQIFTDLSSKMPHELNQTLVLLFFAYMCLGEFSAVLPWTHEALNLYRKNTEIVKSHYRFLFDKVFFRYKTAMSNTDFYPLREKGDLDDLWNMSYIIGILLLSIASSHLQQEYPIVILDILIILFSIITCLTSHKKILLSITISSFFIIGKLIYLVFHTNIYQVYITVHQWGFILLYLFLRYLFNPDYDFFVSFKNTVLRLSQKILRLIVGKETWQGFFGSSQ